MLERIICPFCGSSDLKIINENEYHCQNCGEKLYEKEDKLALEEKILKSLNAQDEKHYANAKKNLWAETHKEYLSNENIKHWCNEVKKYSPDDFFANFYDIVTFSKANKICEYLINYLKNNDFIFANEVVRYLIKTIDDSRIIGPTISILDAANNLDDKYRNSLNELSLKLDKGVFNIDAIRDVFVCYSSKDLAIVSDIVDYLEDNELTCFVAYRNLRHGKGAEDNYEKLIKKAMHNSKCILFISSENSRSIKCDTLGIEIPYLRDNEPHKGRIEYVIDKQNYSNTKPIAKNIIKSCFDGLEFCTDKEDLIDRIAKIITAKKEDKTSTLEKQIKEMKDSLAEQAKQNEYKTNVLVQQLNEEKELLKKAYESQNKSVDAKKVEVSFEESAKDVLSKVFISNDKTFNDNLRRARLELLEAATAQCEVANALYEGKVVAKDLESAAKFYYLSSKHFNTEAEYMLGKFYYEGIVVAKDLKKAQKILWHPALKCDIPKALYLLGMVYYKQQDFKNALYCFQRAASHEYAYAYYRIGFMYEFGNGVEKDFAEALKWYMEGARHNDSSSKYRINEFIDPILSKTKDKELIENLKLSKTGDAEALCNVGLMLDSPKTDVSCDYSTIKSFFILSADKGNAKAQYNAGLFYETKAEAQYDGARISQLYRKAFELYKKAADQGIAAAQYRLGYFYENVYAYKNYNEALNWYEKAKSNGYFISDKDMKKITKLAKKEAKKKK